MENAPIKRDNFVQVFWLRPYHAREISLPTFPCYAHLNMWNSFTHRHIERQTRCLHAYYRAYTSVPELDENDVNFVAYSL